MSKGGGGCKNIYFGDEYCKTLFHDNYSLVLCFCVKGINLEYLFHFIISLFTLISNGLQSPLAFHKNESVSQQFSLLIMYITFVL